MSRYVLDSSFILAVILEERLHSGAADLLLGSAMSSVNYAEVWTKLNQIQLMNSSRIDQVFALLHSIVPFGPEQARVAASLHAHTKHAGLSLGDRACLALALERDAEVVTTDGAWARVNVPCSIHLVR